MKKRKSLKSIILALILCCTMLPLSGITVFAEGTAALATLSVGDNAIDLTDATEYTVKVPVTYPEGVEVFTVPRVKATAADGCTIVSITQPTVEPNQKTATATVVVSDGAANTTYTINMELIGVNQLQGGGFETSNNNANNLRKSHFLGQSKPAVEYAYQGSYGIQSAFIYGAPSPESFTSNVASNNWSKVTAGKKYLYSVTVKPLENNPNVGLIINKYTGEGDKYPSLTEYALNGEYYRNGNKLTDDDTKEGIMRSTWASLSNAEWHVYDSIFQTTADMNINAYFSANSATRIDLYEDNFFLGELVMSDIDVKADGGEVPAVIDSNEDAELNFTGTVKNQLGTTNGLADRTAVEFSLVNAPAGVNISDGTLTVPKGTNGKFIVRATATPDAEAWAEASQESFVEDYEITAVSETYDTLSSVKIGDTPVALNEATNVYNIKAPVKYVDGGVENYVVPALTATAKDPAHEVVVEEGTPVKNKVTTTVTVKESGSVLEIYTFNIEYIGVNQLEGGGFESGENNLRKNYLYEGQPKPSNVAAYNGSYGIEATYSWNSAQKAQFGENVAKNGWSKVLPGKKYLYSVAFKPIDGTKARLFITKDAQTYTSLTDYAITGEFYRDGVIAADENPDVTILNTPLHESLSHSWHVWDGVFSTNAEMNIQSYLLGGDQLVKAYHDNFFLGELVIGDILLNDNAAADLEVSTVEAEPMALTVKAVNQIGSTSGVDSTKVDVALSLVSAPKGVELNSGVLTFEEGATGEVVVRATATPTAEAGLTQTSFVKEFTISLVGKDGFKVENNEYNLRYTNSTGSLVNATLIKAVYTANGGGLKLDSVACEGPISIADGDVLTKSGSVTVENGKVIKLFLCNMENLQPLVINYAE